nr:MAG TPA: minor capsid protein [Caudoviricetes sp.]
MARDDYWARRALADEAAAERLARQAAKEMRRVYREQYEAVLHEIEGLMAEIAEGGTPTRTQLWNYARWRRLEERLREFAREASRQCEQRVTDCLDEVFRTVIGAEVTGMTGTVWQASISPKTVLETAWSGEHYSARIWHNTAAIAQRVRDGVTDMIVQGKGISQVRRRLMEDFSVAYSDADRLVRTEAAYVRNQAALTRYRQNGRRKVRWITGESDGRECAVCRERDGKEYDIDAAPRLPAHPNCRCCYAPVVEAGEDVEEAAEEVAADKPASSLRRNTENDIITSSTTDGGGSVHTIARIDKDIYSCVTNDIVTDEVILTEERIAHIKEHHPNDYERYGRFIKQMLEEPDYIIDSKSPNTAFVLKAFKEDAKQFRLILRLHTSTDETGYKNSVITFQYVKAKEYRRLVKNKNVLYKRPNL